MARKKAKNSLKDSKSSDEINSPTKRQNGKILKPVKNTGYKQFISGLSIYLKKNPKSRDEIKGTGTFIKKGASIWKDLKGKPNIIDNLDEILPQYFKLSVPIKERPKPYGYKLKEPENEEKDKLKLFIESSGFILFQWYQSPTEFDSLMSSPYWTKDCILRIVDEIGNFRDIKEYQAYYNSIYSALKSDYKSDLFPEKVYPEFIFEDAYIENKRIYVQYQVRYWDLVGMQDKLMDLALDREERKEKKELEKIKKLAGFPEEIKEPIEDEKKITPIIAPESEKVALARIESERKEKAFSKEMDILKDEFKEGLWTKSEYREEKEIIRKRYGL